MNRLIIGSPDKSALLLTLMAEDFDNGFTLIDPTGELAEAAADRAPVQRTFYLDPSDIRHPPGFNVFDDVPLDDRHKIAEDMCAYFEAMWPNGWGARSGYIFLNCLRLLLDTPGSTFLGMPKLLTDGSYRAKCLKHCTDPVVLNFWRNEFADWDDRFRKDAIAPLQNKLGALLTSPLIRNILGQRHSTFSLETSNIVIANLNRAKIGDQTAFLLGSLLIGRTKGRVYINDLGFFASDHLATMLPQKRFTLSHQYLEELPKKLQQAVLAIWDKTVFKTTREDAERLAFYMGVTNPSILTDLDPQEARQKNGVIEPIVPPALRRLRAVQRRSRACFTRPRESVERAISGYFAA